MGVRKGGWKSAMGISVAWTPSTGNRLVESCGRIDRYEIARAQSLSARQLTRTDGFSSSGRSHYLISPSIVSVWQLCSAEKLEIGKGGAGPGTNSWTDPVWPKAGQKARF